MIQRSTNTVWSAIAEGESEADTEFNSSESSREQLCQKLQDSRKRYDLTLKAIGDGVWEWDLKSDRINYSTQWKAMVGCQEWEIQDNPVEWLVRVHSADASRLRQNLIACRRGASERFEMEYSLLHKDGQYHSMYCRCVAVKDESGSISHLIGSQTDITERKQSEARLKHDAYYDRLTNLPNRQLFIDRLQKLSGLEQNADYLFGILCLDLDRFKNINHNFGHATGDRLMVEVVNKLQSCLRAEDMLARLGGDEFAILLVGFGDRNDPSIVASRIQQQFSEPIKLGEHSILITVSIGIASPQLGDRGDSRCTCNLIESLENAEIAMVQAKQEGRACSKIFEAQWQLQNLEKSRSADDLRKAIEQEQFELHYQPIVKLEDRQVIGFEALVRWQHPVWGLVNPADFIPLAEDTGLIIPLGWWVLRTACLQMVQWQQESGVKSIFISVNISGRQFSQFYAGDIISQILRETGLNPRCLKLEITESEIIENIELVLTTVEKLKCLGVQLSMDDFGTGYSSLSYLHCLPIDTLKIDRCFIQSMDRDRHQLELVKTIIKLAEVFDLDLVAEGIESEPQLDRLIELRCKYGQGYLFSQAVTPEVAITMCLKRSLN